MNHRWQICPAKNEIGYFGQYDPSTTRIKSNSVYGVCLGCVFVENVVLNKNLLCFLLPDDNP